MIIKAIKKYAGVVPKWFFSTPKPSKSIYTPPHSQLDSFKKNLENIDNAASRKEAAEMLARLEVDEEIYKEKLLEIQMDFDIQAKENNPIVQLFNKTQRMQEEIDNQIEENKQIQARCYKKIQHNKTYGISRIAKEIIEISDHIKQAIKTVESSDSENKISQLSQLNRIHAEMVKVFGKYEIREFIPLNEVFNPNEHEAIQQLQTENAQKKNRIAEVKRTGFKIKEMLIRPASVITYK